MSVRSALRNLRKWPAGAACGPSLFLVPAFTLLVAWTACRQPPLQAQAPLLPPPESTSAQLRAHFAAHDTWVRAAAHDPQRHAVLGIAYAANAFWPQAWHCFSNVVWLDPSQPLAALYLAVATDELGSPGQAITLLRSITNQFPSFPQAFYRLGRLSLRQGELDTAEAAFSRLVELSPNEWRGPAGIGQILLQRSQPAQAVTWLEQSVRLAPHAAPARHLLGTAYRSVGRLDDAAIELRLGASNTDSPMPDPWSDLAYEHMLLPQDQIERAGYYLRQGQVHRAVQMLATALQYEPANTALLNNLAIALIQAGQPSRALATLEQILELEPANLAAQVNVALCLPHLDRAQEALTWAEKARALAPRNAQVHLARANVLLALERDEEVLTALAEAAACDPQNAEIQFELGNVLLRNLGRIDDALAAFRLAVELDPAHLAAWLHLADLHLRLAQPEAAREALVRAERIAPGLPLIHDLRARLTSPATNAAAPETTLHLAPSTLP